MGLLQHSREKLSNNIAAAGFVGLATLTAAGCSDPFETGEIGGIEAPADTAPVDSSGQLEISGVDADGDGEADDTVTLNTGDNTASQSEGAPSSSEIDLTSGNVAQELFGKEGVGGHLNPELYRIGAAPLKAYERVFEETLDGDYEHPVLGTWDGVIVHHEPNSDIFMYEGGILFYDAKHENWNLISTHQLNSDGETIYLPHGFEVGPGAEGGNEDTISVYDYEGNQTYIGGNAETMTQNQIQISGSPRALEDITFERIDEDSSPVVSRWTRYDSSQYDRVLERIEEIRTNGTAPVFTHKPGGNAAPVVGSSTSE